LLARAAQPGVSLHRQNEMSQNPLLGQPPQLGLQTQAHEAGSAW
jgi:hypothetical protein